MAYYSPLSADEESENDAASNEKELLHQVETNALSFSACRLRSRSS